MVFEENNKKSKYTENITTGNDNYNNFYRDDIDLATLNDVNLDSLKNDMESIRNALNNNSLNLSKEEKINLQNELELISNIIFKESQFNSYNSADEKYSQDEYGFGKDFFEKKFEDIDVHQKELVFNTILNDINESDISVDNRVLDEKGDDSDSDSDSEFVLGDEDSVIDDFRDISVDNRVLDEKGDDSDSDSEFVLGDEDSVIDDFRDISVDNLVLDENGDDSDLDGHLVLDEDEFVDDSDSDVEFVLGDEDSVIDDLGDISVDDALNELVDGFSNEIAIKVNNVSMDFDVSMDKIDTLKEFVIRTIKRNKNPTKTVHALKNISFEIIKGDRVGIIGFNGAGKSTLLKLLACVYYPTEGTIETKGKVAPLLELGAGFDNNYTGKDNIFLNGAFLGFPEDFLKEKYDEIVEFSELGEAINYHVKTYSSGMRAKLGFSIATIVEPDILILDEILSVGDIKFARKSADKLKSLINSGITVLIVSHSVSQIRNLCNKAIWIDDGELKMMGNVNDVCDEYVKAAEQANSDQLKNLDLN